MISNLFCGIYAVELNAADGTNSPELKSIEHNIVEQCIENCAEQVRNNILKWEGEKVNKNVLDESATSLLHLLGDWRILFKIENARCQLMDNTDDNKRN